MGNSARKMARARAKREIRNLGRPNNIKDTAIDLTVEAAYVSRSYFETKDPSMPPLVTDEALQTMDAEELREPFRCLSKKDHAQSGFLDLLLGDFKPAATRLAGSSGLGWSMKDHPGHLLFPLFCLLLGDK